MIRIKSEKFVDFSRKTMNCTAVFDINLDDCLATLRPKTHTITKDIVTVDVKGIKEYVVTKYNLVDCNSLAESIYFQYPNFEEIGDQIFEQFGLLDKNDDDDQSKPSIHEYIVESFNYKMFKIKYCSYEKSICMNDDSQMDEYSQTDYLRYLLNLKILKNSEKFLNEKTDSDIIKIVNDDILEYECNNFSFSLRFLMKSLIIYELSNLVKRFGNSSFLMFRDNKIFLRTNPNFALPSYASSSIERCYLIISDSVYFKINKHDVETNGGFFLETTILLVMCQILNKISPNTIDGVDFNQIFAYAFIYTFIVYRNCRYMVDEDKLPDDFKRKYPGIYHEFYHVNNLVYSFRLNVMRNLSWIFSDAGNINSTLKMSNYYDDCDNVFDLVNPLNSNEKIKDEHSLLMSLKYITFPQVYSSDAFHLFSYFANNTLCRDLYSLENIQGFNDISPSVSIEPLIDDYDTFVQGCKNRTVQNSEIVFNVSPGRGDTLLSKRKVVPNKIAYLGTRYEFGPPSTMPFQGPPGFGSPPGMPGQGGFGPPPAMPFLGPPAMPFQGPSIVPSQGPPGFGSSSLIPGQGGFGPAPIVPGIPVAEPSKINDLPVPFVEPTKPSSNMNGNESHSRSASPPRSAYNMNGNESPFRSASPNQYF